MLKMRKRTIAICITALISVRLLTIIWSDHLEAQNNNSAPLQPQDKWNTPKIDRAHPPDREDEDAWDNAMDEKAVTEEAPEGKEADAESEEEAPEEADAESEEEAPEEADAEAEEEATAAVAARVPEKEPAETAPGKETRMWDERLPQTVYYSPHCEKRIDLQHAEAYSPYKKIPQCQRREQKAEMAAYYQNGTLHLPETTDVWVRSIDHRMKQHPYGIDAQDFQGEWTKHTKTSKVVMNRDAIEVFFNDKNGKAGMDVFHEPGWRFRYDGGKKTKQANAGSVSINLVVLEAIPRPAFLHYCRETASWLKGLNQANQSYLFGGFHSQQSGSTSANMIPALTSVLYDYDKHEDARIKTMSCDESFGMDVPQKIAVWNILKEKGFTTGLSAPCANHIMGVKKCSWNGEFDYEAPIMGCRPYQDTEDGLLQEGPWDCDGCEKIAGSVCNLHDVLPSETNGGEEATITKQYVNHRGKTTNDLSLEWIEAFWRTNVGSKFTYTHIDSPHDDITLVNQLDASLLRHLEHMTKQEKTLTILMGDHGPPYEADLQKVPLLSLILSDDLAEARGMWDTFRGVLEGNTHRLVSHIDLYATLVHLSDLSSERDPPGPPQSQPRSLFRPVSPNRTCAEAGIEATHCACSDAEKAKVHQPSIDLIVSKFLDQANEQNARHNKTVGWPCAWLSPNQVRNAKATLIGRNPLTLYDFTLSLREGRASRVGGGAEVSTEFAINAWINDNDVDTVKINTAAPTTMYKKYEACTPDGMDTRFCVCE